MSTRITTVVGAQFGSEGKGAICGHLGKQMTDPTDVAIRVAGPNAGHTVYDQDFKPWKLRSLPVAAVTSSVCQLHIAAGSEIDPMVLMDEIRGLETAGHSIMNRLTIHPSATMIESVHRSMESVSGLIGRIGSTGKGIGAARATRAMREASTWEEYADRAKLDHRLTSEPGPFNLEDTGWVVIEGTQGYGLGLHTRFYPQVTSSDCRAIDFLAMAGISPWHWRSTRTDVILVARINPIRVAGNSGPLFNETTWAELGLPEERTTVTNNVRRVGEWDQGLVLEAIQANGGGDWHPDVALALTMLDHRFPEMRNRSQLNQDAAMFVTALEDELETSIEYVGTGPNTVIEPNLGGVA